MVSIRRLHLTDILSIRQRINEIVASKKTFFGPFARSGYDEESGSPTSEADNVQEEFKLSLPNENNLKKFEAELIVLNV